MADGRSEGAIEGELGLGLSEYSCREGKGRKSHDFITIRGIYSSLQDDEQQDKNDDEDGNRHPRPIVLCLSGHIAQSPSCAVEVVLEAIRASFDIIQHCVLIVHLVAHLNAQHALAPYALAQDIELCILVAQDLLVVGVDLLIAELGLIRRCGFIAVGRGEERGAICFVLGVGLRVAVWLVEADRLGARGCAFGGREVGG